MNGSEAVGLKTGRPEAAWQDAWQTLDREKKDTDNGRMSQVSHGAVWCSDGRLGKTREQALLELGMVDLIARPGAALLLALPESRQSILKEIETLYQLHGFPEFHLVDHTDCGAYRLQYQGEVKSPDQENELHYDNLREAARVIQEHDKLKKVKVRCFLYHLAEDLMEEVELD